MIRKLLLMLACVSGTAFAADGLRDQDHELNRNPPRALHGRNIRLETANGVAFGAYLVGPREARLGILLVHEWWGLNDHIRSWADRFAALGYRALAVDLYGGKVAQEPAQARELMQGVNQDDADAKLLAGIRALKAPGRKLATIGWCFGGGQSLRATLTAPGDIAATVIYYGPLITDPQKLATLKGPVLGIFATRDRSITPEKVKAFQAAMKQAGKKLEVHSYDADHAFANPSGERYDSEAAQEAWRVTQAFLNRNLR
jgi:carboxymethylenebutenolidase